MATEPIVRAKRFLPPAGATESMLRRHAMFEDSTFESTGRIRTRSRGWMLAAFVFNGSILLALVLIPLIYPEALPHQFMNVLLEAPRPPAPQPEVKPVPARATREAREMEDGHIFAPPKIPISIRYISRAEPPIGDGVVGATDLGQGGPDLNASIFHQQARPVVHQAATGPIRLPSTIVAGMIVQKTIPAYPIIAKETRVEGVVVLQATISTNGAIENLRVVSGHPMLRQAALDAVSNWRYRPYLLNGQPVEVETTVNVVFRLTQ
jgi:protein TonB